MGVAALHAPDVGISEGGKWKSGGVEACRCGGSGWCG